MQLQLKPNNPVLLVAAFLLIGGVIFFIQSGKNVPGPADTSGDAGVSLPLAPPEKEGFTPAPELRGIHAYLNAEPDFNLSAQRGKVVLVDFWTYSCINCIRTLPYLKSWHEKYADKGLVIVGVHSPEFAFEKELENVRREVEKRGLLYPVVLDNDFATWRAYQNHYWPHKFLIDSEGYIRYDRIGEGGYEETEAQIIALLNERDAALALEMEASSVEAEAPDFTQIRTPELYLGFGFARAPLASPEGFQPGQQVNYTLPEVLEPSLVALEGKWENNNDFMRLVSENGKVVLRYQARNLNVVAGADPGSTLFLSLDGAPLTENNAGSDVQEQDGAFSAAVGEQRLYNLVSAGDYQSRTLLIEVDGAGFELYTFTFG